MDQRFTKGPDNMNQVVSPSAPLAVVMPGTDGTHLKWRAGGRIQQRNGGQPRVIMMPMAAKNLVSTQL